MIQKLTLSLAAAFLLTCEAHSQILTWNFSGADGDELSANGSSAFGYTGTLTRGDTTNPVADANSFSGDNWVAANLTDAISNNTYFEFTVSAGTNPSVTISQVQLYLNRGAIESPSEYSFFSSVGGFEEGDELASGTLDTVGINFESFTVSYIGLSSVTFRLYAYNGSGDPEPILGFKNGSDPSIVVIPEPSSYALALVGLVGMAMIVRSKNRQRKLVRVKA